MNKPAPFNEHWPIPVINLERCDGCGLCVSACPSHALEIQGDKAVVTNPQACEYSGECELICPTQAITRPYLIL